MATSAHSVIDLRPLVEPLVFTLGVHTHKELDRIGAQIGLAIPPSGVSDSGEVGLIKHERLQQALDVLKPVEHRRIIEQFLERGLEPELRNRAQDALWASESWPRINERIRPETAAVLDNVTPIGEDYEGFMRLLHRLWVLQSADLWVGRSLADEIDQHVVRNPDDWTVLELFKRLGALSSSDRRFALFVEGLLSGSVNPNEEKQRIHAAAIGATLSTASLKIIETGSDGGYPVFAIVPADTHERAPQLLLFALWLSWVGRGAWTSVRNWLSDGRQVL